MNIYVGNLSPRTSKGIIRKAFEKFGKVAKISLTERLPDTNTFGYCFISMPIDNQALQAIKQLHGKSLDGYTLTVKESGVNA